MTDPTTTTHASGPRAGQPVTPVQHPASVAELMTKLGTPDVPTAYEQAHQLSGRVWELAGDMEPDDPDALHGSLLEKATALLGEVVDGPEPVAVLEDALCRRVWAAAVRWAADEVLAYDGSDDDTDPLHNRADRIESGDLTPWADQPEPAGLCEATVHDRQGEPEPCGRERPCLDHPPGMPGGCTRRWGDWDDLPSPGARCPDCGWGRPAHPTAAVGADQPEPATPAAPSPDAPATTCGLSAAECQGRWHPEWHIGARGPAGTRADSPAILGRALLDRDGELWPEDPDEPDHWRLPAGDASLPRASIEAAHGPVREVLLVSPSAGRVLDAARRRVALIHESSAKSGVHPEVWADEDEMELIAAVDAHAADQPAEPAGAICTRCGQPLDPSLTAFYGGPEAPRHGTCPAEPAPDATIGETRTAPEANFGETQPSGTARSAEPAPPLWGRDRREVWAAVQPAPEPDSGPGCPVCQGTERDLLNVAAGELAAVRAELAGVTRDLSSTEEALAEVTADRDSLRKSYVAIEQNMHTARAELTRAQGQVVAEHLAYQQALDRAEAAEAKAARLERDLAANESTEDARLAVAEAEVERLRGETTEQASKFLDAVNLVTAEREQARQELTVALGDLGATRGELATARRLVKETAQDRDDAQDRVEGFPDRLATARRDAAATVLEWSAEPGAVAAALDAACLPDQRMLAIEVRYGRHPVPGSPQPADGGGQDG